MPQLLPDSSANTPLVSTDSTDIFSAVFPVALIVVAIAVVGILAIAITVSVRNKRNR